MPTPLTPHPPNPRRRLRAAFGAGLAAAALTSGIVAAPSAAFAQDDTIVNDNAWATDLVQAPAAWETTTGEGVTVAVMDTGVGMHPFFEDKDILPGFSILPSDPDGRDDNEGHGTGVAAGVLLAAPDVTILPVRSYTGAEFDFAGGWGEADFELIRRTADEGADIIVVPWTLAGLTEVRDQDREAFQYAIDKGAIIVAATGNEPGAAVGYPAVLPGVVAVTGVNEQGQTWTDGVTTGPEAVLSAPADTMTVPMPQDDGLGEDELYRTVSGGTSMASGIVAGIAALTLAAHPDLDASNVIQRLIMTAGGGGDRGDEAGYGLVNADQAVNAEGVEPVEENPLGYPMGEAGASGATPDEEPSEGASEPAGAGSAGPSSSAASGNRESNLSTLIVVAAAVVLVGAAVAVWLVLRGRSRKAGAAQAKADDFGPGPGPAQGGYQQPGPGRHQQQYSPPPAGQTYGGPPPGQGYGGPPPGPQQGYGGPPPNQGFSSPPPGPSEQSPPWRPSDPNRR